MDDIINSKRETLAKRKKHTPLEKFFHRIHQSKNHIFNSHNKGMPFHLIIEVSTNHINEQSLKDIIPSCIGLSIDTSNLEVLHTRQHLLDLKEIYPNLPIIQNDLIIDPYQIYESRFQLMDHIALHLNDISSSDLLSFILLSREQNMRTILKVHNEAEIDKTIETPVKLIEIDESSLINQGLNLDQIIDLAQKVPQEKLIISRVINPTIEDLHRLKEAEINCVILPIDADVIKNPQFLKIFPKINSFKSEENLSPL
ncbi:MAG: hypothetical protein COB02_08845 [Candidatus Cloacimonadota bacterium]|nr:MAG: hypothetical protein COB02_08845 [Candidatus Cloacimonadota bacterium]